jgi:hypothetical protein
MISLGSDFENAVLTELGIDPATVETGTVQIPLVNSSGKTTVMYTVSASIDTQRLAELINAAAAPFTTQPASTPSGSTTAASTASVRVGGSVTL